MKPQNKNKNRFSCEIIPLKAERKQTGLLFCFNQPNGRDKYLDQSQRSNDHLSI